MSSKPTIILVHGFWGGAAHWSRVILELSRLGHAGLHAVELPLTSLADDAERLRKMIAQQPGPVLLAGHSYGGAVITSRQPAQRHGPGLHRRLRARRRRKRGRPDPAAPARRRAHLAPDSDGYLWLRADKFHESFCQDLSADDALVMAATQAPLASAFGTTVTRPAWRDKPSWYQISSQDRMITPENQTWMSGRLNARKVITLDASHASLASRAPEVAALIDEAARA